MAIMGNVSYMSIKDPDGEEIEITEDVESIEIEPWDIELVFRIISDPPPHILERVSEILEEAGW